MARFPLAPGRAIHSESLAAQINQALGTDLDTFKVLMVENDEVEIHDSFLEGVDLDLVQQVIDEHQPPPPPAARVVTKEEFLGRFTDTEEVGISVSAHPAAVKNRHFLFTHPRDEVHLDSQKVIDGLNGLVAAGLLAPDRPAQIRGL